MALEFEWDGAKARTNKKKHGVSFEEAASVFADPLARIFDDEDHSEDERRELIIGYSGQNRLLIVSFTERGADNVRIISARKASKHEQREHEKNC